MSSQPTLLKLTKSGDEFIAYHRLKGKTNRPGIIFLGGFMSDMEGTKALALEAHCKKHQHSFLRFDYMGHGQSSGQFEDGTIGLWANNVITVLDQLTEGPQILVGSSMGGWLMLLAALARPKRIASLVGIASAPDFTKDLIWDVLDDHQKHQLQTQGKVDMPSDYSEEPYPITLELIEEGKQHLLLNRPIKLTCPVRLIHGMKDDDVPYTLSLTLAQKLQSTDIHIHCVKNSDHRMSDPQDIALLCHYVDEMLAKCRETF